MNFVNKTMSGIAEKTKAMIVSSAKWYRSLADTVKQINAKPSLGEIGVSGTEISGYYINEEYLAELIDPENRADVYDKMRKSDPVINLCLLRYELFLQSIKWSVDAPAITEKGKQPAPDIDEKVKLVKANLFENPVKPWRKTVREFASMLQFGYCVMEKVWESKAGKVFLKSLKWRHPRTILWKFREDSNELEGIEQRNYYGNRRGQIPPIPVEKLLIFSHDQLGDNYEGVSIIRSAYRSWHMKKELLKRMMICFERYLVKTPIIEVDESVTDAGTGFLKDFLSSITSHQKSGGILPTGAKLVDLKEDFNKLVTALKQLEYFDKEMSFAVNSASITIGMNGKGSLALSEDKSSMEVQGIQAVVDMICDVVNYGVIPDIIDANFEEDKENQSYPVLSAKVTEEDYQAWIDNTVKLVEKSIMQPYAELVEQIATRQGYPEPEGGFKAMFEAIEAKKAEQEALALDLVRRGDSGNAGSPKSSSVNDNSNTNSRGNNGSSDPKANKSGKPQNNSTIPKGNSGAKQKGESPLLDCECCGGSSDSDSDDLNPWRPLTSLEESSGGIQHFAEQSKFLDISQKKFESAVKSIVTKQADEFLSAAKKGIPALMKTKASFVEAYREAIEPILFETSLNGVKAVQKEMGKPGDISKESIAKIKEWSSNKAMIAANQQAEDLRSFIGRRLADGEAILLKDKASQKALSETASNMAFSRFLDLFNLGG